MPEKTLQDSLDTQRTTSSAKRPAEINEVIARAIDGLVRSGISRRAPGIGSRAPDFALPDVHGREVRLGDLLARGPVVLAFYRGVW